MKSFEFGGLAGRWSSARIAGLVIGVTCVFAGLLNTGRVATGSDSPARGSERVGFDSGAHDRDDHSPSQSVIGDMEHVRGLGNSSENPKLLARGGSVRNIPPDFSVVFAAAAGPDDHEPAGLMADTNFDGVIDGLDVDDFVEAINTAIDQARRNGYGGFSARYDLNDDGRLDDRDLELYFDALGFGERGPRFKSMHLVKC
ncbi:MAG: hypothetical protein U0638_05740 [Phycisphaerales bacterium]